MSGIARRSFLRAAVNRRIQFQGDYSQHLDHIALHDYDITVVKALRGKSGEDLPEGVYAAGSVISIETKTKVQAYDRILYVKAPQYLYKYGSVSVPNIIDATDGMISIKIVVTATKELDVNNLPPVKIYIEGES
jgi:hypothetical protein